MSIALTLILFNSLYHDFIQLIFNYTILISGPSRRLDTAHMTPLQNVKGNGIIISCTL